MINTKKILSNILGISKDNNSKSAFLLGDIKAGKEAEYFKKYWKKSHIINNDPVKEAQVAEALLKQKW